MSTQTKRRPVKAIKAAVSVMLVSGPVDVPGKLYGSFAVVKRDDLPRGDRRDHGYQVIDATSGLPACCLVQRDKDAVRIARLLDRAGLTIAVIETADGRKRRRIDWIRRALDSWLRGRDGYV